MVSGFGDVLVVSESKLPGNLRKKTLNPNPSTVRRELRSSNWQCTLASQCPCNEARFVHSQWRRCVFVSRTTAQSWCPSAGRQRCGPEHGVGCSEERQRLQQHRRACWPWGISAPRRDSAGACPHNNRCWYFSPVCGAASISPLFSWQCLTAVPRNQHQQQDCRARALRSSRRLAHRKGARLSALA